MHDYVKALGTVIRKAREEQGMSQTPLAGRLGIDVRIIIDIKNFREDSRFEMFYPLVTTSRAPTDRVFYLETESVGDNKQQLFWELHSLSEKEVLGLLPVIRCLVEMVRRHGSENP